MYKSQEIRKIAPEMDPLRMGMGWKVEDLGKPQIIVESTYGNSHPGSGHLNVFVEEAGVAAGWVLGHNAGFRREGDLTGFSGVIR